jgi:hypothetical protein
MYLMAGLLVVGFFCNLAVRPVGEQHYMPDDQLKASLAGQARTASR